MQLIKISELVCMVDRLSQHAIIFVIVRHYFGFS